MEKSFSSIEIKSVQDEKREITGWASTPAVDRVKDIVEPLGLTFQPEAPLLLNHDHAQPVGTVRFGAPTPKGLPFTAKIAKETEPGIIKNRTDEAWHSVKNGLIKGVSIGFMPEASSPLPNGGTRFTKASVHELSLVAVPANPEAVITNFKGIQPNIVANKDTHLNLNAAHTDNVVKFLRPAIASGACTSQPGSMLEYVRGRWGENSDVIKALVNPVDGAQLVNQRIYANAFVQAVFSTSILGKLRNLTQVPPLSRVPFETNPLIAQFVGEGKQIPAAQGDIEVTVVSNRKIGAITVVSEELLRLTNGVAERLISGMVVRSLSRGVDAALMGSQARDADSPQGLSNFAPQADSFEAGMEAFTGDLASAAVVVNPLTAVGLRTEAEQGITAAGGTYKGFPVITSIAVPVGKLFIVDGSRILAYLGTAHVETNGAAGVMLNTGDTVPKILYNSGSVGLKSLQYADWNFVPGAAVEVTIN